MMPEVCILIPARSGSKSILNKNLELVGQQSLLDRAITTANALHEFRTVLSSDSAEYLDISASLANGEKVLRPPYLASDQANIVDTIKFHYEQGSFGEILSRDLILVVLEPTSPFVTSDDVRSVIDMMANNPLLTSAMTVTECNHTSLWINQRVTQDEINLQFKFDRAGLHAKQNKERTFIFGNVVCCNVEACLTQRSCFTDRCGYVELPYEKCINVDSPSELLLARAIAGFCEI